MLYRISIVWSVERRTQVNGQIARCRRRICHRMALYGGWVVLRCLDSHAAARSRHRRAQSVRSLAFAMNDDDLINQIGETNRCINQPEPTTSPTHPSPSLPLFPFPPLRLPFPPSARLRVVIASSSTTATRPGHTEDEMEVINTFGVGMPLSLDHLSHRNYVKNLERE